MAAGELSGAVGVGVVVGGVVERVGAEYAEEELLSVLENCSHCTSRVMESGSGQELPLHAATTKRND